MSEPSVGSDPRPVRIGAVRYLNARPLTFCLDRLVPDAEIVVDVPSRLADSLASGRLDVALAPSIEYCRNPGCTIVSDACIACDGPARSVKLYSRVPVERIRTLSLDEGSRASAALTRILLKERFGVQPEVEPLAMEARLESCSADATMLIGDRGMQPVDGRFEFVWDMGQKWSCWTGLPFVFAMWIARPDADLRGIDEILAAARDEGVARLEEIARLEARPRGIPEAECLSYLRDHLDYQLGDRQRQGLKRFYELAGRHGLAPAGVELVFYDQKVAG